jgi:hypothetical protein
VPTGHTLLLPRAADIRVPTLRALKPPAISTIFRGREVRLFFVKTSTFRTGDDGVLGRISVVRLHSTPPTFGVASIAVCFRQQHSSDPQSDMQVCFITQQQFMAEWCRGDKTRGCEEGGPKPPPVHSLSTELPENLRRDPDILFRVVDIGLPPNPRPCRYIVQGC